MIITLTSTRLTYPDGQHQEYTVLALLQLGSVREDIHKSFSDDVFADLRRLC